MNEVSNGLSGTNGEYVEFVVVSNTVTYSCSSSVPPCIDIRGWIFDDNSGYHGTSGIAQGAVRFSQNPLWSCIPLGTIILIYNKSDKNPAIPPDDLSMSDGNCTIVAPVDGALFEINATTPGSLTACSYPATGWTTASAGTWSLSTALANGGDCARIVDLAGCEVFSVCYGTDNLNTEIYFAGNGGQKVYYFNDIDPTNQANWTSGDASVNPGDQTPGAPNNAANAAYIAQFNNGCMPITSISVTATSVNAGCTCNGSATANATGSIGGYSYVWYDASFNPIGQTSATATNLCAGVYNVIATSHIGCSDTTSVTISSSSTTTVAVNSQTVCLGSIAVLTATPSVAGGVFSWSPGGQTTASVSVSPGTTTTYSVTYTLAGCSGSNHGTVTVVPLSTVTVNSPTICNGQVTTITASGASTYSWSTGAITNSISVSPTSPTNFTVIGTTNTCTGSATSSVVVNSSPTITVNSSTICAGQSATLVASGANTYTWSNGSIVNPLIVSPTSNTTFTVAGSTNGCNAISSSTIIVNPSPTITVNSATICPGQTATLTANGANTYTWSTGISTASLSDNPNTNTTYSVTGSLLGCINTATANIIIGSNLSLSVNSPTICIGKTATLTVNGASTYTWSNGSTANSTTVSPLSTSTYSVVGSTGSCSGSIVSTVVVNALPNVSVNSSTICSGQMAVLTANGANTYMWNTGEITSTIQTSPNSNSSFTVIGTTNSCSNIAVSSVSVNSSPTISVNSSSICSGQSATLSANGAATYLWNTGAITSTISASPTSSTNYTVIGTSNSCSNSVVGSIIINTPPNLTVSSTSICSGQTTTLTASGATNYLWNNGSTSSQLVISPSITTTYSVTGSNGNCLGTGVGSVIVNESPNIVFNSNITSGCPPLCVIFSNNTTVSTGSISAWNWSFGNGDTSPFQTPSYCFTKSGLYNVALTATSSNGCFKTVTIPNMINVFDAPTALFTTDLQETDIFSPSIQFINQSTNAVSYDWSFGDSNQSSQTNPSHTFNLVGVYVATLVATSQNDCRDTIEQTIKINDVFTFYAPNTFTPNGDDVNDLFIPVGTGWDPSQYKFYIYDRWGNQCFSTDDKNKAWDGRANNGSEVAQIDTYTWKVELKDIFGTKHKYIGKVMILR